MDDADLTALRIPGPLRDRAREILAITDRACIRHLDDEYARVCRQLVGRLARKRPSPLARGETQIWAAGAIYAVGQVNFLFDRSQQPHVTADQLSAWLGVVKTTMANKAALINKTLNLGVFEPDLRPPRCSNSTARLARRSRRPDLRRAHAPTRTPRRSAPARTDPPPRPPPRGMTKTARLSELDALIDDLTVDAYGEEQLAGSLVGADEALQGGEPASIVGVEVKAVVVDAGPDARIGLTARVRRDAQTYDVALTDLTFDADSQLGRIVSAYRRWQGRTP